MKKTFYFIDVLALLSFLIVAITGVIKMPIFGIFRYFKLHLVSQIHDYSGLIFLFLCLIHIILHFKIIIAMTKNLFKEKKWIEVR
jgi:hypothetical protein